jgi:hypothetical protein
MKRILLMNFASATKRLLNRPFCRKYDKLVVQHIAFSADLLRRHIGGSQTVDLISCGGMNVCICICVCSVSLKWP